MVTAEVKEIEIKLECDCCGTEEDVVLDDAFNQDLSVTLHDLKESGWMFIQDSQFGQHQVNRKKTIMRDLLCFCDNGCYKSWLDENKEDKNEYANAELKYFCVDFEDELQVKR